MIVPGRPIHQKDGKINGIKVGHDALGPTQQTPTEAHDPISRVVDFSSQAPVT